MGEMRRLEGISRIIEKSSDISHGLSLNEENITKQDDESNVEDSDNSRSDQREEGEVPPDTARSARNNGGKSISRAMNHIPN